MDSDEDEATWAEPMEDLVESPCLFCNWQSSKGEALWNHAKTEHEFDLVPFGTTHKFDVFGYLKFINFMREKKLLADDVLQLPETCQLWSDETWMTPHDANDVLLQFDYETYAGIAEEPEPEDPAVAKISGADEAQLMAPWAPYARPELMSPSEMASPVGGEGGDGLSGLGFSNANHPESKRVVKGGRDPEQEEPKRKSSTAAGAKKRDSNPGDPNYPEGAAHVQALRAALIDLQQKYRDHVLEPSTSSADSEDDRAYSDSYGHFAIHAEMLKDNIRTGSYHKAIMENAAGTFAGKRVLDVGCGTGVLSMFAARAGAKEVIGVDLSDIAFNAMQIVRDNELESIVKIKHCKVEALELTEPVDVIISEWMGYFLLFECMLDSVLYARDHLMKDDGIVLPDKYDLVLCGLGDGRLHNEYANFWNDVYGLDMSAMRTESVKEASVHTIHPYQIITDTSTVQKYDLNDRSEESNKVQFVSDWRLTASRDGELYGWVAYFTTSFEQGCVVPVI